MKKKIHYLLMIALAFSACKKETDDEDDDGNTTPTVININSPAQFSGKVDGTSYSFVTGGTLYGNGVSLDGGSYDGATGIGHSYLSSFIANVAGDPLIGIQKRSYHYVDTANVTDFGAFFAAANYSYTDEPLDGVMVFWTDANGTFWTTAEGSGTQTGSVFTIRDKIITTDGYECYAKIHATFNCTLYDGNGNSMQLTDGIFVGTYSSLIY